jgi:hypothetical protein
MQREHFETESGVRNIERKRNCLLLYSYFDRLCVEAYRLVIPYGFRNLVINDLEVKALLQTIHTVSDFLF